MSFLFFLAVSLITWAQSKGEIRDVVKTHSAEMRQCYQAALKKNPKLQGKLTFQWSIDDEGQAKNILLNERKSNLTHQQLIDCMTGELAKWKFEAAPPGMTIEVNYPFVFNKTVK